MYPPLLYVDINYVKAGHSDRGADRHDNLFVGELAIVEFIFKFHCDFCLGFDSAYLAVKLQKISDIEKETT